MAGNCLAHLIGPTLVQVCSPEAEGSGQDVQLMRMFERQEQLGGMDRERREKRKDNTHPLGHIVSEIGLSGKYFIIHARCQQWQFR
jgi:hypothetical protein